jgi:hypothetical protein
MFDEEDLRVGVIDQIMDVSGLEFMKQGDRNGPIGHGSEETDRPVGLVAGADDDLVARDDAVIGKSQMHLRDAAGKVTVE